MRLARGFAVAVCLAVAWSSPAAAPGQAEATHTEIQSIGTSGEGKIGKLATLCVAPDDRLLACDAASKDVKVFDLAGKLKARWSLPFAPSAICTAADGAIYVGGALRLAKLDKSGKVVKAAQVDPDLTGSRGGGHGRFPGGRPPVGSASGMAVTDKDLFVSFGSGWSTRAKAVIVRFDLQLGGAKRIASNLNGCCQRLDLATRDGVLYVAENCRHRVVTMDRDGRELGTWGRRDRSNVEGFGSCCNPMNLCFGPRGALYTSESGLGRVKRYSANGEFQALIGEVGVTRFTRAGHLAASCSNIAIGVSADGRRIFIQDVKTNGIRVLTSSK